MKFNLNDEEISTQLTRQDLQIFNMTFIYDLTMSSLLDLDLPLFFYGYPQPIQSVEI